MRSCRRFLSPWLRLMLATCALVTLTTRGMVVVEAFAPMRQSQNAVSQQLHHDRHRSVLYGHFAPRKEGPYIPEGMSKEDYATLKQRERDQLQAMDFGHFGPRFHREATPEGDWFLMPYLWTEGAVDTPRSKQDEDQNEAKNEQILEFLQQYGDHLDIGDDAMMYIMAPVVQEDSFLRHAWEQGHSVCMLGVVPSAAMDMRSWFGGIQEWKEVEKDGDNDEGIGANVVWQHSSGRATLVVGDVISTDVEELLRAYNVLYDHMALQALEVDERTELLERLSNYLVSGGLVFTEADSDSLAALDNGKEQSKQRFMLVETVDPPMTAPEEEDDSTTEMEEDFGVGLVSSNATSNDWIIESIRPGSLVEQTRLVEGVILEKVNGITLSGKPSLASVESILERVYRRSQEEGLPTTFLAKLPSFGLPSTESLNAGDIASSDDGATKKKQSDHDLKRVSVERSSLQQKLGLRIEEHDGTFRVRCLSPESPFQDTALKEGMELVSINGISVRGRDMASCGEILRGCVGTVHIEAKLPPATSNEEDLSVKEGIDTYSVAEGEESPEPSSIEFSEVDPTEGHAEHDVDNEAVFDGSKFQYLATLGDIQRRTDGLPKLVETGHLLQLID